MQIHVHDTPQALGRAAGREAAAALREAVAARGAANYVVATGASQFDTLAALVDDDVPWERITGIHLGPPGKGRWHCCKQAVAQGGERSNLCRGPVAVCAPDPHFQRRQLAVANALQVKQTAIGQLPPLAPILVGSGLHHRKRLFQRAGEKLPRRPAAFHGIDASRDAAAECRRLAALVPAGNFDVATIGIGENGHLAFNDPPADFTTSSPYIVVRLDEACRRQQVGEGWFAGLEQVPTEAISMAIRRILATARIICSVPDARKARAVRDSVAGPLTPDCPASILRTHAACSLHVDLPAAALLPPSLTG